MDTTTRLAAITAHLFDKPDLAASLLDWGDDPRVARVIASEMTQWTSWPTDIPRSVPLVWLASFSGVWPHNPKLVAAFTQALDNYMNDLGARHARMDDLVQNQLGVGIHRAHTMWTPKETIGVIQALAKTFNIDPCTGMYRTMTPLEQASNDQSTQGCSVDSGRFKRMYYNVLEKMQAASLADRAALLPWLLARDVFSIDDGTLGVTQRCLTLATELVPEKQAIWNSYVVLQSTRKQWVENTWYAAYGKAPDITPPNFTDFFK